MACRKQLRAARTGVLSPVISATASRAAAEKMPAALRRESFGSGRRPADGFQQAAFKTGRESRVDMRGHGVEGLTGAAAFGGAGGTFGQVSF